MNSDLIRQRKYGKANSFALLLRDGIRLRVKHPHNMAISPRRVFVIGRTGGVTSALLTQVVAIKEERPRSKTIKSKTKRL